MNRISLSLFFSLLVFTAFSQQRVPCASDENNRAMIIKYPQLLKMEDEANAQIRKDMNSLLYKAGNVKYIPVVFHIIHGNGFENIQQAQIMDQIRILNEDYRKLAGTNGFNNFSIAADMEIEFRLAQYDPSGNKSDGINRIYHATLDSNAGDATKALITWDSKKYLNIWVVNSINSSMSGGTGTVLGYAQFPWLLSTSGKTDGIMMRADQVGTIMYGDPSQEGRTLTHEIGHWLGLYHTFQSGCVGGTSATCQSQGDQVCDTPPVSAASYGCQTGKNSCTNDVPDSADLITNYMDYSDGTCMNMFTNGQKARVQSARSYRQGIFGASPSYVQDISYAGLNADGTYITVPASSIKAPYFYGFEESTPTTSGWRINNFNTPSNGWQVNSTIAHSGTNSFYMRNFTNTLVKINSRDGFQTPEIDLTTAANPTLEFYYAYAQKNTATNDSLIVRISDDFGMHETYVWRSAGATMSTAGIQSSEYFPVAQEWQKVSMSLSPFKNYTHARFRFELLNRRGNNIYIDDVAIRDGATGIQEKQLFNQVSVYPNPFSDKATLQFTIPQSCKLSFSIVDMNGRTVTNWGEKVFNAGQQTLEISREALPQGLYMLIGSNGEQVLQHKLLIY